MRTDKALNIVEEYAQADIEAKIELIIRKDGLLGRG